MFHSGGSRAAVLISCDACAMQHTDHCRDCVVSALLEPSPRRRGVVVDAEEERALRELAHAGLIPEIRMRPRRRTA
ncbi:MAG TPA: hypothetical protein VFA34_16995 [Actinomycetota bacterium]|nr:hypothetical protein [Actinomycetota bacterium]